MRQLDLTRSAPGAGQERTARLARHLEARLRDFGPGGPEVLSCDQRTGTVTARFPGHSTMDILEQLDTRFHIRAAREGETAVFHLSPDTRFEDLDYLWGCLFELL